MATQRRKQRERPPEPTEPAPASPAPAPWPRWTWAVAAAVVALFALLFTVPWQPADEGPIGGFDFSWMLVLHDALANGRQFGKEIILPQGPLGFFGTSVYDPRTYPILIAMRAAAALVGAWALWRFARRYVANPALAALWAVVILTLIGRSPDHFFPACALLLVLTHFFVDDRLTSAAAVGLTVLLAAASLIKVNQPFYVVVAIGTVVLGQILRREWRAALLLPAVYFASLAVFYLGARQRPSSVGALLWGWYQVTVGHTDAVGLPGPTSDPLIYLTLSVVVAIGVGVLGARAGGRVAAGALPALGSLGIFVLLYKHSFMRQDIWHVHMGPSVMLAAAILLTPMLARYGRAAAYACGVVIVIGGVFLSTILSSFTNESLPGYGLSVAGRVKDNVAAIGSLVTRSGRLHAEWEAARAKLRDGNPLPVGKIVGPVDVYPHRQNVVLAYGLPYRPRPVISSLVASGPPLAELNAAHLRGPDAAPTVLFEIELVDRNFPTALDGPSIPELLTRYDVADESGAMLVLRKSELPARAWKLQPLVTLSGRFDEAVSLPAPTDAPLWANVRFTNVPGAKLKAMLYKPPTVGIVVRTADGTERNYRLLPSIAAEQGFLISPLLETNASYAALTRPDWPTKLKAAVVTSILVFVEGGSSDASFESTFTVELRRLEIGPR